MDSDLVHDSTKKCVVKICKGAPASKWKKITENMLNKAGANKTLASYYKDHENEYMCMSCYNAIVVNRSSVFKEHAVEWEKGLKRCRNSVSMSESISLLTNIIFEKEIINRNPPIVSFSQLRSVAENKNNELSFFFDQWSLAYQCYLMCWNQNKVIPLWNFKNESTTDDDNLSWIDGVNILTRLLYDREKVEQTPTIYSFKQLEKNLNKLDKRLAVECYIICGNQNFKLTAFKENISLFLDLMGASAEALDALSYAGITMSQRHLDRIKTEIVNDHLSKINSYLKNNKHNALALNVDDYHNIHSKRVPDTCSTSNVAHMTTLVLNHIDMAAIPRIMSNGASIHNPKLIDFELVCNVLGHHYMEQMAKTFNDRFYYETSLDEKLENMTLHSYNSHIQEQQEERKMKDTSLLDFFELKLEYVDSYINALQHVYEVSLLNNYLTNHNIPIIADWPGQVFIRQAITLYLQNHWGGGVSPWNIRKHLSKTRSKFHQEYEEQIYLSVGSKLVESPEVNKENNQDQSILTDDDILENLQKNKE
ncbi:22481_t:CDS:2, partial [Cetraspora pellucida]